MRASKHTVNVAVSECIRYIIITVLNRQLTLNSIAQLILWLGRVPMWKVCRRCLKRVTALDAPPHHVLNYLGMLQQHFVTATRNACAHAHPEGGVGSEPVKSA